MENIQTAENVFAISIDDLQFEAMEKLGRELNEEEIQIAKKGLEYGLLTNIQVTYNTIFTEMI